MKVFGRKLEPTGGPSLIINNVSSRNEMVEVDTPRSSQYLVIKPTVRPSQKKSQFNQPITQQKNERQMTNEKSIYREKTSDVKPKEELHPVENPKYFEDRTGRAAAWLNAERSKVLLHFKLCFSARLSLITNHRLSRMFLRKIVVANVFDKWS